MERRKLGSSEMRTSPMGLGCWAIGGPFTLDGKADGWGQVDDRESIRAIHAAIDRGINFFDTADAYGTGHSEEILGRALAGRRSEMIIATKFGFTYDAAQKELTGTDVSAGYLRKALEASLKRLGTPYIDLYQLHCGTETREEAQIVADTLEALVNEEKIRAYGWSYDEVAAVRIWRHREHFVSVQNELNVLHDAPQMLAFCEAAGLASINRSPPAYGFLSGKYTSASRLAKDDFRGAGHEWVSYYENGKPKAEFLEKLANIRDVLTSEGRSLVQGALAWIWARSPATIPIPGFKTEEQVRENTEAMDRGPLTPAQMQQVEDIIGR
jgi:aryl-alcohol dehydrogenase-like predicted oxidoreductase